MPAEEEPRVNPALAASEFHGRVGSAGPNSSPIRRPTDSPSPASVPRPASLKGPTGPTLRANPFPEVTDLFCRLPLPTLFYRPEAFHLGDLLRIWVRLCTKFTHLSSRFSRANASASDGTRPVPLLVVANPISGQTDSRVHTLRRKPLNKKRQLSPKLAPTSLDSIVSPHK